MFSSGTNFCDYKRNLSERESGIHFAQQIEFLPDKRFKSLLKVGQAQQWCSKSVGDESSLYFVPNLLMINNISICLLPDLCM